MIPAELARLGQALIDAHVARGTRLAVAESCTGGLLGAALTHGPGASRAFAGGVIAYANEAKTTLLDVEPGLLAAHGAVSIEVARAMAEGAARRLDAAMALSITGVAGPGGGSAAKPVGHVVIARAWAGETRAIVEQCPGPGRAEIRLQAVRAALLLGLSGWP